MSPGWSLVVTTYLPDSRQLTSFRASSAPPWPYPPPPSPPVRGCRERMRSAMLMLALALASMSMLVLVMFSDTGAIAVQDEK